MKSKIFKRSVWAIVTLFFAILMGIFIVLQDAVVPYERWIDNFFGVRRTFLVNDDDGTGLQTTHRTVDDHGAISLTELGRAEQ